MSKSFRERYAELEQRESNTHSAGGKATSVEHHRLHRRGEVWVQSSTKVHAMTDNDATDADAERNVSDGSSREGQRDVDTSVRPLCKFYTSGRGCRKGAECDVAHVELATSNRRAGDVRVQSWRSDWLPTCVRVQLKSSLEEEPSQIFAPPGLTLPDESTADEPQGEHASPDVEAVGPVLPLKDVGDFARGGVGPVYDSDLDAVLVVRNTFIEFIGALEAGSARVRGSSAPQNLLAAVPEWTGSRVRGRSRERERERE